MARKEQFVRTGKKDPATGAELVTMEVKVKDKKVTATKRYFEDTDQLGGLSDEYLLKCVNYAEDLFVRAATTRENTDEVGKKAMRSQAREHWRQNDKESFVQFFVEESHTEAEINAKLEAYYAENLANDASEDAAS